MRKYGPIILAAINTIAWLYISLNDLYILHLYKNIGSWIIAALTIVWALKGSEVKFRKLTYVISGLLLVLYAVYWTYVIIYAIGYEI